MPILFPPDPTNEDIRDFMDEGERALWDQQGTQGMYLRMEVEDLWRSIPDPTEAELKLLMRDEEWGHVQRGENAEGILSFYRRKWKKDRRYAESPNARPPNNGDESKHSKQDEQPLSTGTKVAPQTADDKTPPKPTEKQLRRERIQQAQSREEFADPNDVFEEEEEQRADEERYLRGLADARAKKSREDETARKVEFEIKSLQPGFHDAHITSSPGPRLSEQSDREALKPIAPLGVPPSAEPEPTNAKLSTWSVWIQRGLLAVAAGLAWWLFERFDAPVWVVALTLGVCLVSIVSLRWLEKTAKRRKMFIVSLIVYALFAIAAAIVFSKPSIEKVQTPTAALERVPPPFPSAPKTEERQFIDITPEMLIGIYKKYNTIQADEIARPYIGKWMKYTGAFTNAEPATFRDERAVRVTITPDPYSLKIGYLVMCESSEQRWINRVTVFRPEEKISVIGRIDRIIPPGIMLKACEVIEQE